MIRLIFALVALFALAVPAHAQIDIMAPFNQDASMDDAAVLAKGIAFADGERMKLDVYGPKNQAGPAPVVMFIYGGAWSRGDTKDYQFVGKAFAANGFVAVVPNYRLYPEVTYPGFLEDNARAVKWIEDNIASYGGDTSRFFHRGALGWCLQRRDAGAREVVPQRVRGHHAGQGHRGDLGAL